MQKTKKAVAKRFKITASGKVLRRTGGYRHLLRYKTNSQKRRASKDKAVPAGFASQVFKWVAAGL